MRFRIFVSLVAFLLTASLYAQTNEIGVFVNHSSFSSSSETDPTIPLTGTVKIDSKAGYGISFNHYFSPNLAIQFSGQTIRGKARLGTSVAGVNLPEADATLDMKQYDAALRWYVIPSGSFRPYVGAGIAWIGSGKLKSDVVQSGTGAKSIGLENKTTWLAAGGVDFSVSPQVTITLAGKYTHYTAELDTTPDDLFHNLKLNPLTVAAGIGYRF